MRGPGLKTALDVRRLWRCPACGYERRADGRVTTLRCQCSGNPLMQLVGEPKFQRLQNRAVDPYVDAEELLGALEPEAAYVPANATDAASAIAEGQVAAAAAPAAEADSTAPASPPAERGGDRVRPRQRPRGRRDGGSRGPRPPRSTSPPEAGPAAE